MQKSYENIEDWPFYDQKRYGTFLPKKGYQIFEKKKRLNRYNQGGWGAQGQHWIASLHMYNITHITTETQRH